MDNHTAIKASIPSFSGNFWKDSKEYIRNERYHLLDIQDVDEFIKKIHTEANPQFEININKIKNKNNWETKIKDHR